MFSFSFLLLLSLTVFVLLWGTVQFIIHKMRLKKIPWRIHVNGTRGKSSVTRLIAAGLRAGGVKSCAKTTGTLPRMIMPDGREFPVFRPGKPNISEQLRIVRAAGRQKVQALVVECMALQPHLQYLSEDKFIRATHGVITNCRPDHLDIMGPTEIDVALALCGMIPKQGLFYTQEKNHLSLLEDACRERHCRLLTPDETHAVSPQDMEKFAYIEHAENVSLALKVCNDLGVPKDVALSGMQNMTPDAGALTCHVVDFFNRRLFFFNGFAANDPNSTEKVWRLALNRYAHIKSRIAIFNCRLDRPERSVQLAEALIDWPEPDHIVLMGTGTYLFAKRALEMGIDYDTILYADHLPTEEIFEKIVSLTRTQSLIVGMGNIAGQGLEIVQYFKNRSIVLEEKEESYAH